jgi:cobalt-zinc-cadmium efflux system protein
MIAEVAGGLISGSLALLADAGHMLTDFAALSMAWIAFALATKPANARYTYGYERLPILVAFVNALTLFAVAIWIVLEAIKRFLSPGEILAGPMMWVAVAGLCVNLIVFWILMGADKDNLNIRGAVLHVFGDLLGSVAAIAAAIIILLTGWTLADPLLSVLVALFILRSAWFLIKASGQVLLQGTPAGLDANIIQKDLSENIDGLIRVDDIRVWSLTQDRPVMTLAAYTDASDALAIVSEQIKSRLKSQYGIEDVTVEISTQY